jgi:hypothetical protein
MKTKVRSLSDRGVLVVVQWSQVTSDVYRGSAIPGIRGHYFYSDFCAGFLRSLRYQSGVAVDKKDWGITALPSVTSFGRDAAGELYMVSGNSIFKIVQGP